jgi:hypothetical protein
MAGCITITARERLVAIEEDLEGLAEVFRDLGVIASGAEHAGPAAFGLEALIGAGEIA